ncbi:MAG: NADP-dependent oxidoreductase domain protein, partial [Thermoleophilia bacterium]|nr:NADP-dependent oxidoreductase domain protein [Thermoleophilia bacterium]
MTAATTPADVPSVTLDGGVVMPQLGYGVWQVPDDDAADLVRRAIEAGYRSVDTAAVYENEHGVGEGLRASGVARDELFVTTKLWNTDQADARRAFETSLRRLGLDHVDLYLIHWPSPARDTYVDAWRALVEVRDRGQARAIGVSNFGVEHLERIAAETGVTPAVNQVELHPWLPQHELRAYHAEHGIATEAWSPLGQGGELLAEPVLGEIAAERGCTTAQVVLAWHLRTGTIAIPKSATPSRIVENLAAVDVVLSD